MEDREITRGMAAMEKDIKAGLFPDFKKGLHKGNFGKMMIFGTAGEINKDDYKEMFNNPQGYSIIKE